MPPISIILLVLCCLGCQRTTTHLMEGSRSNGLPTPPREFRAAWVASVANINWPSKPGLSSEIQKKEARQLLDLLQFHHYNAVILQVRPQCDALYQSELEPWSYFLTGQQGKAPDPFYDPLTFWINEAHQRGLELHAWLNPYRAHHTSGGEPSDHSIVRQQTDLVVQLKNGFWWMDPANPQVQDHSYQVVMDIVNRYDVDGIHFDDYFYPYPSYNEDEEFPDHASWQSYQHQGGKLSRGDWRRKAVNEFIKKVYHGIKKKKRFVKFGLSPFGIWRPNHPPSIRGFDEVLNQIMVSRGMLANHQPGTVHWSIGPLISSDSLATSILHGPYKEEALVPEMRHLSSRRPNAPMLIQSSDPEHFAFKWQTNSKQFGCWIFYQKVNGSWSYQILPANKIEKCSLKNRQGNLPTHVAIAEVNRFGKISAPAILKITY